jgi:catechol 2,3-dioxygenase-like lactoylglutathione lyase family enzyme
MKLKLHHLNLCTTSVRAMEEFYRRVFDLMPEPSLRDARVTTQGYAGDVAFLSDGTTQFHLAQKDLSVAFRMKQSVNPLERGHIAFRTDDIAAFKKLLDENGIPYSDYGTWAMSGWHQIFFQDPDGNIIEVHQVRDGRA